MSDDYLNRLRTDPRAEDARQRMQRRGLRNADQWAYVVKELAAVPGWYEILRRETQPARDTRRDKLARKIEDLAEALRDDPEASALRIFDHASVISSNVADRPTVADYLTDVAEHYATRSSLLDGARFDRKQSLKSFALIKALDFLTEPVYMRRAPNREAELLVSALLDTDIHAGTLTQIRKNERDKYATEK